MPDGEQGGYRAGDADGLAGRARLRRSGDSVAVKEARRCEETCARFEGVVRALKEDTDGCLARQHTVHADLGGLKDHVKMLDKLAQRAADTAAALLAANEAAAKRIADLEARVAVLEAAALPPAN